MQDFLDFRIRRFDWLLIAGTLKLELEDPYGLNSSVLEFSNVLGWHLDDVAEGCTISSLTEIEGSAYLEEDRSYIQAMRQGYYSRAVGAAQRGEARVWSLKSSYGLRGYIIAKNVRELSNP